MAALDLDRDALTEDDCAAIEIKKDETALQLAEADEWKEKGNIQYKEGNYEAALECYGNALDVCPGSSEPPAIDEDSQENATNTAPEGPIEDNKDVSDAPDAVVMSEELSQTKAVHDNTHNERRAIYHSNRAACFQQLGKDDDVINECDIALALSPRYVKALMRRAAAFEKAERFSDAISDYKLIVDIEPPTSTKLARGKLAKLEKLEAERLEKLKEETMGKLKELGNSLLGNFGLSTDNFKFEQDKNTGSYNVQFVQNANP